MCHKQSSWSSRSHAVAHMAIYISLYTARLATHIATETKELIGLQPVPLLFLHVRIFEPNLEPVKQTLEVAQATLVPAAITGQQCSSTPVTAIVLKCSVTLCTGLSRHLGMR